VQRKFYRNFEFTLDLRHGRGKCVAVFVATRFGLVALIASGYSWLAVAILTTYVLPLVTLGLWRILRRNEANAGAVASRPT
jgi:hypothetical protein